MTPESINKRKATTMKKLFKNANLSLMAAMIMLITPLVIISIVSTIYLGTQEYQVYEQATDIYFDTMYTINSNLVNVDRDFYQAMMAATQCYDLQNLYNGLSEDELQGYLAQKVADYAGEFETARAALSGMFDIVETWAENQKITLEQQIIHKISILVIATTVIIVGLIILALATAKSLSDGIKRVSGAVGVLAEGDFVTPIGLDSPIKEFRNIAAATEDMRGRLQDVLLQVKENALSVNNGAEETRMNIEDSQRMTTDISHAVSEIANGATAMASDVQSASDVTINIGDSVEAVLESVNETSMVVTQISSSAETIIAIASQTNLLALNASIEAARAGEAGKGFAVVADNIKNLAEESNLAANEITDMLKKITELSEQNKNLTEDIKDATETEAEALQSMSESFGSMLVLLRETEEGNRQILNLVEALNDDKNTIMSSVESLSAVSQQNAASTEETSASLTMLDTNMEQVVSQARNLTGIADRLQENISIFKV